VIRYAGLILITAIALGCLPAHGSTQADQVLQAVDFRQTIGATVPLDETFTDADGHPATLRSVAGGKPVILLLAWYDCENLCPLVMHDLATSLSQIRFRLGPDFQAIVVSIDPSEGPEDARRIRDQLSAHYDGPGRDSGWRILTGDRTAIDHLADSVGYAYTYDPVGHQYAHPAGITFRTPAGQVSGYLFGLNFAARDLRLALTQAGEGRLGSPIDRLVLRCCDFDPATGTYSVSILRVLNLLCLVTVIILAVTVAGLALRSRRSRHQEV
jgi:protein SCO1/2